MASLNEVLITISGELTGDTYEARSYPDDDLNNNGLNELYKTPVFKVFLSQGSNLKEWKALRFMPFWNDPRRPTSAYKSQGFLNSGLSKTISKKLVTYYDPNYGVHNRYSPFGGAIRIRNNFLVHAGPQSLSDFGWGAAGCVEIVGDFDNFKDDIKELANSEILDPNKAILDMIKKKKLFIEVKHANAPNLRANFTREVLLK